MSRRHCRFCGAPIRWARTERRSRPIMLNPHPDRAGLAVLADTDAGPRVRLLSRTQAQDLPAGALRYSAHSASCTARNVKVARP